MKHTTLIITIAASLLFAASAFFLHVYYERYETMEKSLRQNLSLDPTTANAIKHATAAADMFNLLKPVLGEEKAETAVIRLGVANEYIERVIYYGRTDTAREIMKDLHNNYAGIVAAKLADQSDAFPVILSMGSNRTLIVNEVYNPFFDQKSPEQDVVGFGYDWFKAHHEDIDDRIEMKVMRAKDLRPLAQIKISSLDWNYPVIK